MAIPVASGVKINSRWRNRFGLCFSILLCISGRADDLSLQSGLGDTSLSLPDLLWSQAEEYGTSATPSKLKIPQISITALSEIAYAQIRSAAILEIARTDKAGDLPVILHFGGTAVNGSDFELLPNTVVIPNEERSVQLEIRPIPNERGEGNKTVIVQLIASPQYSLGPKGEITVWIFDIAYNVWRAEQLGRFDNNSPAMDRQADPDGDGLSNYVEFLFDLDPLQPDRIRPGDWKVQKDKSYLRTSLWCRNTGLEDFKAIIEYSTNFVPSAWIQPEDPAERFFASATPLGKPGNSKKQMINALRIKPEMESALFLRIRIMSDP